MRESWNEMKRLEREIPFQSFAVLDFLRLQRGGETQGLCVDGQVQGGIPAPIGVFRDPVHPITLRLVRKHQGVDLGVGGRILGGGEGAGDVSPAAWSVRVMVPPSSWAVRFSRGTFWMEVPSAAARMSPFSWDWRVWAVQVRPSGMPEAEAPPHPVRSTRAKAHKRVRSFISVSFPAARPGRPVQCRQSGQPVG